MFFQVLLISGYGKVPYPRHQLPTIGSNKFLSWYF